MNDLISRREVTAILDKYRVPDSVYHEINKLHEFSAENEELVPFDFELFQAGLMDMPDGMTNGEVIQALFPNISIYEHGSTYSVNNEYNFNSTWWNAPYKAESEEHKW